MHYAMAAAFCLPALASADDTAPQQQEPPKRTVISPEPAKTQETAKPVKKLRLTGQKYRDAITSLDTKQQEAKALQDKATEVTVNIGKLASGGKLLQDEDSMKLMKQMVDQLQEIKDQLKKIDEEIGGIKGWIEGQNEALPVLTNDVLELKKTKTGGYVQFQYRDTDQKGGLSDSFRVRRAELSLAHTIDSRTSLKVTFDLASSNFGSTVNQPTDTSATLKDVNLVYDIIPSDVTVGTFAVAGQVKMPLGNELTRSSSEREFPEYTAYNQALFAGERGRGINLVHGLGKNALVQAGVWNALTYNDPEQRTFTGSQGNRLGVSAGLRYFGKQFDVGISGFVADRPEVQVGYTGGTQTKVFAPTVKREFIYLDGTYVGLFVPGLFIRGEAMFGKDRLPLSPNSTSTGSTNAGISNPNDVRLERKDMVGFQTTLGYKLNKKNTLLFKYEQFDPDTSRADDFIRGYGAGYMYLINPNAKLTLTHEIFIDDSRLSVGSPAGAQRRYGVTTLRVQFKF